MRIARFCCRWGQEFHRKKRKLVCLNFAGYSQQHCLFLTIIQTPRLLSKDQANIWLLPWTGSSCLSGKIKTLLTCYTTALCLMLQQLCLVTLNNATDDIVHLSRHLCPENLHPIIYSVTYTTEIFQILTNGIKVMILYFWLRITFRGNCCVAD